MQALTHFTLWLLVLVNLGRFQELFPFLVPLRLGILSAAFGLVVVLATNSNSLPTLLRDSPIKKYLIALIILAFVSIPLSVYPGDALGKFTDYLRLILICSIIVALGIKNIKSLQLSFIAVLIILSIQMLMQKVGGRISVSSTYDPNDIAVLCVTYLPFAIHGITQKNIIIRITSLIASGGAVASVGLSGSRGGLLALVAVTVYAIILAKKRRMLLIFLSLIGAAIFSAMAGEELWLRIQALLDGTDYNLNSTGDSRFAIWTSALEIMIKRPLWGVGIGQFVTGLATLSDSPWRTAHNSFIQIGLELGFGGLYAYCAIFYTIMRIAKKGSTTPFLAPVDQTRFLFLRMSLIGFCTGGFFVSHAYTSICYMLFCMGAIMGLDLQRKEKLANEGLIEANLYKSDEDLEEDNSQISSGHPTSHIMKPHPIPQFNQAVSKNFKSKQVEAQSKRNLKKSRLEAGDMLRQQNKIENKLDDNF